MNRFAFVVCLLVIVAGGWLFFYGADPKQQAAQAMLDRFSEAVATQDQDKIRQAMQEMIADDAAIHLDVVFHSLTRPEGGSLLKQDFDKTSFIDFIGNILYSLNEYSFKPHISEFTLAEGGSMADITLVSNDRAYGKSYIAGVSVDARFGTETRCTGQVRYVEGVPELLQANCRVRLVTVPKTEDVHKLMDSLKDRI